MNVNLRLLDASRRVQEVDKADGFNDLGKIKWELALCLFFVFIFVYFALWKGIKSSGKVSLLTMAWPSAAVSLPRQSGSLLLLPMVFY